MNYKWPITNHKMGKLNLLITDMQTKSFQPFSFNKKENFRWENIPPFDWQPTGGLEVK